MHEIASPHDAGTRVSDRAKRPNAVPEALVTSHAMAHATILEELLADQIQSDEVANSRATCLVGECVDDCHAVLQGRVLVRFGGPGVAEREVWVPTLKGLPVRLADRVLLVRPDNGEEWIVTGVVDGFARRPVMAKQDVALLELKLDESVKVVSSEGHALVEISRGEAGPVVRVLQPDVNLEFAGKLAIKATSVEFEATQGTVTVKASDDVVIRGEVVHLN